jgi:hypothetical protein
MLEEQEDFKGDVQGGDRHELSRGFRTVVDIVILKLKET